jgi:hypothetical protein
LCWFWFDDEIVEKGFELDFSIYMGVILVVRAGRGYDGVLRF